MRGMGNSRGPAHPDAKQEQEGRPHRREYMCTPKQEVTRSRTTFMGEHRSDRFLENFRQTLYAST
eukprot:52701-Pyramimonas_sp.AAC.1